VVVVVSAMSGETNRLIAHTKEVAANPAAREPMSSSRRRTGHDRPAVQALHDIGDRPRATPAVR